MCVYKSIFALIISLIMIGCSEDKDDSLNNNSGSGAIITDTTAILEIYKAGELSDLIPTDKKYAIKQLTLSGELNGKDIKFIREMAGCDADGNKTNGQLAYIDLTNANITTGGEPFYIPYSNKAYYSKKNIISSYMFYKCNSIVSLKLPNSITKIEVFAMDSCMNLASIRMGSKIKEIGLDSWLGEKLFYGCKRLKEIIVDTDNSIYSSDNGILYNKEQTILLRCPEGMIECFMPNSVQTINKYAFIECKDLTTVVIGNNVKSIDNGVLSGCTNLTSVTIPNSIVEIGNGAFSGCTALTSVTIPNSVVSIGEGAFDECVSLASVNIPSSITKVDAIFKKCTELKSIVIPYGVERIDKRAFDQCNNITFVTLNCGVYDSSWFSCAINFSSSLKEFIVNDERSAYSVIDGVLFNKEKNILIQYPKANKAEWYIVPNSVEEIGRSAFIYCWSLKKITINSNLKQIGLGNFMNVEETHCQASIPPEIGYDCYRNSEEIKLYIPKGTYEKYINSVWGKLFSHNNIIEE